MVIRSPVIVALALGLAVWLVACGGPSTAPSAPAAPSPAATPASSAPAAPSPTTTPEAAFACVMPVVAGALPSDRLVGVEASGGLGFDRITFRFAPSEPSSPTPLVPATGELREARPPFVQGASGLPLDVDGERFVSIVFRDMVVADEEGRPTYDGPAELRPGGSAIRHVVLSEAFEGVVSWIVGLRGPGCVRVAPDPASPAIWIDVASP